jgi:type III pantothenate kinase
MNIVVDYGNTTAKVGIFNHTSLTEKHSFGKPQELKSYLAKKSADNILVSSVSHPAEDVLSWGQASGKKIALTFETSLPIQIHYATPQTLGVDRIAAVCGAFELFPGQNCLVIDAGTCLTFEFLDAQGNYYGGSISPGVTMRFEAMHRFTSRLPLVKPISHPPLIGADTTSGMQSGVVLGIRAEVTGMINQYFEKYPTLQIILCGGDHAIFENHLKPSIFVAEDLVLIGLNRIIRHNARS